jgi:hypothetical protein
MEKYGLILCREKGVRFILRLRSVVRINGKQLAKHVNRKEKNRALKKYKLKNIYLRIKIILP